MEIAFITANKLQVELENKQGRLSARILASFMKHPSRFIGAMLVGNNIALVIYGIFMGAALVYLLDPENTWNKSAQLLVQTIISTLIILVTAEFLPKTIFRINPNRTLRIFSFPLVVIYVILWIPMIITIGLAEWMLRLLGIRSATDQVGFARIDLENYVYEMTDRAQFEKEELDHEVQIFKNALHFSNVKTRDCMIPRTDIVAVSVDEKVSTLREMFVETGLSKVLIYRNTIDNIIGYVHSYELFKHPESITEILLPVSIVPEAKPAHEVLNQFVEQHRSIAVVVDEFGGTAGLITIEDIIEEIFGEIEDEHDREVQTDEQIGEGEYRFSAKIKVDLINSKYELNIPESEEYETIAGYIINRTALIPEQGKEVRIDNFRFVIEEVSDSRIDQVLLKVIND